MILIRLARFKDVLYLQEILRASFKESIQKFGEAPPLYDDLKKLSKHISEKHCFLAFENKNIVGGYICYLKEPQVFYLSRIFVHPLYQGKGIGKLLIEDMFNRYKEAKVWQLHTVAEDTNNKHFYEKLGFKKLKEEIVGNTVLSFYQKEIE